MGFVDLSKFELIEESDARLNQGARPSQFGVSVNINGVCITHRTFLELEIDETYRYADLSLGRTDWEDGTKPKCMLIRFRKDKGIRSYYVSHSQTAYDVAIISQKMVRAYFGTVKGTYNYRRIIVDPAQKVIIVNMDRREEW